MLRSSAVVARLAVKSSQMQLAMGISIGVVLALLIGVLLFLVRKRPERIKKVLGSFIRTHRGLLPASTAPASVARWQAQK